MRKFYSKNTSPDIRTVLKAAVLSALVLVCFAACTPPTETPENETFFNGSFDFETAKLPCGMTLGCSGDGAANPVIKDGVMTIDVKQMYEGSASYLTITTDCKEEMELSYKVYMDTFSGYKDDKEEQPGSGKFRVYIDSEKVREYDGYARKWEEDSVDVSSGIHTIKFVYEKTSNYYSNSRENIVKLDDIALARPVIYSSVSEDFEGSSLKAKYNWIGRAILTSTSELGADANDFEGVTGKFVKLSAMYNETTDLTLKNVVLTTQSSFSFKYLPCIWETVTFSVFVDNTEYVISSEVTNIGNKWITKTVTIPAGNHTITIKAENPSDYCGKDIYNAVFIDDISLIPDVVAGVKVTPRAKQQTYIGCKDYEKIVAEGYAVRADGTIKSDVKVTFSATGGTIDENGVFTPTSAGKAKITASYGEFTADSGEITVYNADYMKNPFAYNGKTYNGAKAGTESGELTKYNCSAGETTLTFPACGTFEADGFFTIEGKVNNSENYNYAIIDVLKGEASEDSLRTSYIVHDDFCERIWLRHGKGDYTVIIYNLIGVKFSGGGVINWEKGFRTLEFKVTNTRDESAGGESDGRWIYPSDIVRSDNFLVTNTTDEVLYNLPNDATDRQKITAIHDYIVRSKYYDDASVEDSMRKKQDAISVLQYGTAVCEGYANLTAAMARYAGIPVKYISGANQNPAESGHAWNNVYIDGTWYFLDTTWDDDNNPNSDVVRHDYFLLEAMDGVDGDHAVYDYSEDTSRNIIG